MDVTYVTNEMKFSLLSYRQYLANDNLNIDELIDEGFMYIDYKGWLHELLNELIRHWCNPDYSPDEAKALIENDEDIKTASLEQIVGALTFIVRRDRFSAGSFFYDVKKGVVLKLLNRLEVFSRDLE